MIASPRDSLSLLRTIRLCSIYLKAKTFKWNSVSTHNMQRETIKCKVRDEKQTQEKWMILLSPWKCTTYCTHISPSYIIQNIRLQTSIKEIIWVNTTSCWCREYYGTAQRWSGCTLFRGLNFPVHSTINFYFVKSKRKIVMTRQYRGGGRCKESQPTELIKWTRVNWFSCHAWYI